MSITFKKIDPFNQNQAITFINWNKDPVMIKNWTLQGENNKKNFPTIEDFKNQFEKNKENFEKTAFMIKVNGKYIGYGQIQINHPVALTKEGRICWPCLAIGDNESREQGFGLLVCKEILRLAKEKNCTHIEAAVFEFNQKMKSILIKNNFKFIGKQENKTFNDGKWWSSEHYLLKI